MADPPPYSGSGESGAGVGPGPAPPRPRWVKVFLSIALVLLVLFVFLLVTGGPGHHGAGRHFGGDDPPAGHKPPAHVRDHGAP